MSDANNLDDFFAQQSKRKTKAKKGPATKAKPAAAATQNAEERKDTETEKTTGQPEAQPTPAQDFADSSDDESNQIVINEDRRKIVDRKELEASKKKGDDKGDGASGWGLGTAIGKAAQDESTNKISATAKGPQTGVKMNFGKPSFTRKQ